MSSTRWPPTFIVATPFVPSLDHASLADRERERRAAVERAVELLALGAVFPEPAGVVHDAGLALLRRGAGADLGVLVLQAARGLRHLGLAFLRRLGRGCGLRIVGERRRREERSGEAPSREAGSSSSSWSCDSFLGPSTRAAGVYRKPRGLPERARRRGSWRPCCATSPCGPVSGATGAIYFALGIVSARVAFLGDPAPARTGSPGRCASCSRSPTGPSSSGPSSRGSRRSPLVHLIEAVRKDAQGPDFRTRSRRQRVRICRARLDRGAAALPLGRGGRLARARRRLVAPRRVLGSRGARASSGLSVAAGGLWEAWQGVRGGLPLRQATCCRGASSEAARGIARFGLVARGLRAVRLGYFICPRGGRAAIRPACSRWAARCGPSRTRPSGPRFWASSRSGSPRTASTCGR